jgi:hypothetical protein
MAYDPNFPASHAELTSPAFRAQFQGLHAEITSIPQGPQGEPGPQGDPGEVSQAALDGAIGGTSNNTNGVGTLDDAFADPDMETLRNKMNEFILAARR